MPEHQQIQQSKKPDTIFQKQATSVNQTHISNPASIIQRAKINPKSLTHADVMQLQRTIGNKAVGMLLSGIGSSSTAQQAPVQRQEIPEEEKTCPSCIQKQEIPEEEEPLQGKVANTIQRQEIPEEEEPLQGKFIGTIQRQEIPEEEEPLQGKVTEAIQRQEFPEEEEPLQGKFIETIQRQEIHEEEEPLQGKFEGKPEHVTCSSCFANPSIQKQEIPGEEEPLQGKFTETTQRQEIPEEEEPLQGKFIGTIQRQEIPEEEEPLQGRFTETIQRQETPEAEEPLQTKKENNTGLPDNLKAGVENLSGIDTSDVRVQYNSSMPAEVGALAYTQGTNIHVAQGQEKHLPHEAWHVVQQKQGRVQPIMQAKGVSINDDAALEHEADMMGAQALDNVAQLQRIPEKHDWLVDSFSLIARTGTKQGSLHNVKSQSDPANISYRLFSKSADVIQRAFHPARVNSKAHLRFGATPADIQTDKQIGRAIPKNEEVITDPDVNEFVQHRTFRKEVTWIRAVDTRPDKWDPLNDKTKGGYIRQSSTSPISYPLPASLDIFGVSLNLQKYWQEHIGEYTVVEKSILIPSDDIVKIGNDFKRMNADQVYDLSDLENAQLELHFPHDKKFRVLNELEPLPIGDRIQLINQLMSAGWSVEEIIDTIDDSFQQKSRPELLKLLIDQPKDEYPAPQAVESDKGVVKIEEGGLEVPRQNFSMPLRKLRQITLIFDDVMSNIKYDSSVVPLEFIHQVQEIRMRIPEQPLSKIYEEFDLASKDLVEQFKASDCVGMAELVKARLEAIGVGSYVIGTPYPNYLIQIPNPKGSDERVIWEQAKDYAVFSHASVIVPFTDTKNMPHAIHIETGMGPDPKWFRLFSNWKQCLDRLEQQRYDPKRVVNPSELAKKHIKCKWRMYFATDASQNKKAFIDLVEGSIWLGEAANEGSRIASTFKGSKINFEDVLKEPHKEITINVNESEIKLSNIEALALYLDIIKKEFGLAEGFVKNMLYLAAHIAEFRQDILLDPITTLAATRTLRETVSRERENAIKRAGTKDPKVTQADEFLKLAVTAVKQGNTEEATRAYQTAIKGYQQVEGV